MKYKETVITILSISLLFFRYSLLLAQSEPSLVIADIAAEEVFLEGEIFVVTAARRPQKVKEAPSTIDVITSQDIKNWGVLTLAEALRLFPGIDVKSMGVFHAIGIRGLGNPTMGNTDRVLLLVDGQRINVLRSDIPLTNVERIEVIRGPGSSLYGPNAFAGVVNIITKSGDDVDGIHPSLGAGDNGAYLTEVLAGKRWGMLDGIITFRHYQTDGQELLNDNEEFREGDVFGKIMYKGLTLSAGYNKMDRGDPGRIGRLVPDDDWEYTHDFVDLSYNHQWEKVGLNLKGYFNETETVRMLSGQKWDLDSNISGAEIQGNWMINKQNLLTIGIDLLKDDGKGDQLGQELHRVRNTGLYMEHEIKPLEPLILTIGGRYDVHSVYEDVFSPRLSAVYLLGNATTFRVSYGKAFKAPGINDLYADVWLNPTMRMLGNEDLKPERLKTYELGINHSISETIEGSLTAFLTEAKDIIATTRDFNFMTGIMTFSSDNIGEAEVKGFEFGLKGNPFSFLSFFGNYSYQDGEDEDGNNLVYVPHNKFNLGLNIHPVEYASLNLTVHHVGKRDYEENVMGTTVRGTLDSYTTTDLKLQGNWKRTTLSLTVYNLFNEIYQETKNYLTPERRYLAKISYRFW